MKPELIVQAFFMVSFLILHNYINILKLIIMRTSKSAPKVNAGSMADIAFLLLIFFLVTTTIANDKGINRKLPRNCPIGQDCRIDIHERNILRISLNNQNEVMVDEQLIAISELKDLAKDFLDNNGDSTCDYCSGDGLASSSDNPKKAVISFQSGSQTSYEIFIKAQNELTKAYAELREVYVKEVLGKSPKKLAISDLNNVKAAYPFLLSEAETN